MLQAFANTFKIPDLRKKILITFGVIAVYRLGTFIPTPGIDGVKLAVFFENLSRTQGGTLFGVMNLFSGGAIHRLTIFALGIMPYISSSIIMQLLTVVIPALEKLAKEGQMGYRKINQYTRYGTIVLSVIQSFFIALWLENPAHFGGLEIVSNPGLPFRILTVLTLTTGSAFIMWLGEQIQEKGIGNGMSIIVAAGILSRVPTAIFQIITLVSPGKTGSAQMDPLTAAFMLFIMVAAIVAVIMITQGERKIPVQYAKRVVGRRVYGGQSTHIPLKINTAGVIPPIFASSIIAFPATIAGFIQHPVVKSIGEHLAPGSVLYTVLYVSLIVFFCFFYTAVVLNPVDMADNMKKYGGFIPGIRPGQRTSDYVYNVLTRITFAGALYLAMVCVIPELLIYKLNVPFYFGGTSLLIVIGVGLDTAQQIESHMLMRNYEGFLETGPLKGRSG